MTQRLTVILIVSVFVGCGLSPAAKERRAADTQRRADHIAKLKSYVPAHLLKTVDPEFYSYPGFRDWWRFPLTYPYSIQCIDTFESGDLCRHDGKSNISDGEEAQIQGLSALTAFSFDARYLVGLTDIEGTHSKTGSRIFKWVLIEFATGEIDSFESEEGLATAAKARGYSGDMELEDVKTRYEECFEG